jgi:hypothetical protein
MTVSFVFVLALTRKKSFGNFRGEGGVRMDWWAAKHAKARTSAAQPISQFLELQVYKHELNRIKEARQYRVLPFSL